MSASWYAVYTLPQCEEQARRNLENQGFTVFLPRYRKERRHARKVDVVLSPLFPRYLFIYIDPKKERWRSVNGSIGVKTIVSFGDQLARLREGVIEAIMDQADACGIIEIEKKSPFKKGDSLEVLSGPLREQIGIFFSTANDNERVIVLMNMMGRQMPVILPIDNVASCA